MPKLSSDSYKSIQELYEKHDIIVDMENSEVVMKRGFILDNFIVRAFILKFSADEHLTGRILRKESCNEHE